MLMIKLRNTHTHTNTHSHTLPFITTLSEAGVEGARAIGIKAVCDWPQAEVNHLVKAELAAVDGGRLGLQCDEELLCMLW